MTLSSAVSINLPTRAPREPARDSNSIWFVPVTPYPAPRKRVSGSPTASGLKETEANKIRQQIARSPARETRRNHLIKLRYVREIAARCLPRCLLRRTANILIARSSTIAKMVIGKLDCLMGGTSERGRDPPWRPDLRCSRPAVSENHGVGRDTTPAKRRTVWEPSSRKRQMRDARRNSIV
jgi:hypothetical protein